MTHETALRAFARAIIEDYCWGYGEPDGGDTIYKFADWLKE